MLIKKEWMRHKRMIVLAVWWLSGAVCAFCQQWSMKTNLLSDAVLLPSLGAEYAVTPRWTVALDASWMPLRLSSEHYLKELKVQPEAHYWFRAPFTGPFVGPALSYRLYNFGGLPVLNTKDSRTQGYLLGVGCTAGWHFSLGPRWGLELYTAGLCLCSLPPLRYAPFPCCHPPLVCPLPRPHIAEPELGIYDKIRIYETEDHSADDALLYGHRSPDRL